MKIVVATQYGDTAAVTQRLMEEGHKASLLITDERCRHVMDGIIESHKNIHDAVATDPDLFVIAETKLFPTAEALRHEGFSVFGATFLHHKLEHDRFWAIELARKHDAYVPKTAHFKGIAEGISFLKKAPEHYIVKFDEGGEMSSFVGETNDDVIAYIEEHTKDPASFILQEYVDVLTECNVEIWFSGGAPLENPNGTIEQKRFAAGDMGPNTGCQSSIVWPLKLRDRLVQDSFGPGMLAWAKSAHYTGPLDMALLISKKDHKPYFIEFTPRFGINAVYALFELYRGNFGELLYKLAHNEEVSMPLSNEVAFALTVSIPPYPYDNDALPQMPGQKLKFPDDGDVNFWFYDVRKEGKTFVSAGTSGLVFFATATGPREALDKTVAAVKSAAKRMKVSQMYFRSDAGEQAEGLYELEELGYA